MARFAFGSAAIAAAVLAALLIPAVPSIAGDAPTPPPPPPPNSDPAKRGSSPRTEAVVQAMLADQVARFADRGKDVMAMITAARLLSQVSPRPTKIDMRSEGKPRTADGKGAAPGSRDTTVNGLLARAKKYAGVRNDLNGIVDEVAKSPTRGKDDGPARVAQRIGDHVTDVYTTTFRANEPVVVGVTGDGLSDLDLTVDDDNGIRICTSAGAGDDEMCRWTPRRNGAFRIRVRNMGNAYNEYRLWFN